MTHAVCPGSFDPPTLGHLDVFGRAAGLFDRVTVAVLINPDKKGLFSVDERLELLRETTAQWPNITIDAFHGLLVDYCRSAGIAVIVKGLRGAADFDYERQMAQMNHDLSGVDTLFLATNPALAFVSSSLVKQVATLGGNIDHLLPDAVAAALAGKLHKTDR